MKLDESYLKATLLPIWQWLEDDTVNEIKISHYKDDVGAVWVYRYGNWESAVDKYGQPVLIENKKIEQIIGFVAGSNHLFAHKRSPIVESSVPELGYRFTGVMKPCAVGISQFNIRKFSTTLFTLEDYVEQGVFEEEYIDVLMGWLKKEHFTICIAGSTNSGKTTFLCSLINEKRKLKPSENWVVIEDTRELTIPHGNVDRMLTTTEVSMDDLLKVVVRRTPDRVIIGEVRGKEASTALEISKIKTIFFTLHAGKSCLQALSRFERMVLQHPDVDKVDRVDIAENINGIISLQNVRYKRQDERGNVIDGFKRQIVSIDKITDYDSKNNMYQRTTIK